MMHRNLSLGLCLAAVALATPAAAQQANPRFSSLVVFGDSLVDAGNIATLGLGANTPGYFMGRFTNGYDYTDLLSIALYGAPTVASLQGGSNHAFGGARATTSSPVPDLREQLAAYGISPLGNTRVADPDALYVLNFGGNDIFAAAQPGAPTGYTSDSDYLMQAATLYAGAVQSLNDAGARNIFVTGFPVATPGIGLDLSTEAEGYLTTEIGALALNSDTSLFRFDYLDFFARLQADPSAFRLPEPLILPGQGNCRDAVAYPACTRYVSFDGTHPTAAIHQALFEDIDRQFGFTSAAAVPEPAAWALMMLGFGLIGGTLRARRTRVTVTFG